MAKIKQDFSLYAGEDKDIVFTITNDAGAAVDLSTALKVIWVVARLASTQQNLITKIYEGATLTPIISGTSNNILTISITGTETEILNGKYRHELRLVNATSAESVLAIGQCQVYNSLTKDLVTV